MSVGVRILFPSLLSLLAATGCLYPDLPEAVANAARIADECRFVPELGRPIFPEYPVRDGEFVHWKLNMERRYPIDVEPLKQLLGIDS